MHNMYFILLLFLLIGNCNQQLLYCIYILTPRVLIQIYKTNKNGIDYILNFFNMITASIYSKNI